ncbi:hypothetical protein pb186bvf_012307 [Paramecium bursaria]
MNYYIRKRLHTMLQIAGILTAIGAWTIWAATNNFKLALLGYGLIGLSQSIFLQCPVYLSELWFSAYERTLVTSLTGYSLLIGSAFSYTYSSYYFFNVTDSIQIYDGIEQMNLIIAWMNTVGLVGCFFLIRAKEQPIFEKINWMEQYKKIIFTEESILDLLVFGVFIGVQWQYINVLSLQLYGYGFDQEQIGLTGVINQFGGAIGGIIIALILDREVRQGIQPNYDIYIKISTSLGLFFLIIEVFLVDKINFATLIFINFLIGLGLYPCYPLFFASCSEKIFPIQSLVILTVLLIIGNVVAFGLGYLIIQPAFLPYGIWISIILISPGQFLQFIERISCLFIIKYIYLIIYRINCLLQVLFSYIELQSIKEVQVLLNTSTTTQSYCMAFYLFDFLVIALLISKQIILILNKVHYQLFIIKFKNYHRIRYLIFSLSQQIEYFWVYRECYFIRQLCQLCINKAIHEHNQNSISHDIQDGTQRVQEGNQQA